MTVSPHQIRNALIARDEIALIDLREESAFALGGSRVYIGTPNEAGRYKQGLDDAMSTNGSEAVSQSRPCQNQTN